jgi:hypothetical protein
MTKDQIQAILERVLTWPEKRQEDAARILLQMEQENAGPHTPDEEDLADLDAAEAEIQRGEPPVPDDDVKAFFESVRRA